jgi:hypothetical protein
MVESKSGAIPNSSNEYSELSRSVHPIEGIGEFLRFGMCEAGFHLALGLPPLWPAAGGLNQNPQTLQPAKCGLNAQLTPLSWIKLARRSPAQGQRL